MLQRVRYRDRPDRDEPSDWPGVPDDYDSRVDPVGGSEHDFRGRPRRKRRSIAGRVFITVLVAVTLMSAAAAAYFAARSGALDDALARSEAWFSTVPGDTGAASPTATAAPSTQPQPTPTAPDVARSPLPDVEGLVILIRNAIVALQQANDSGNYTVLHDIAAPALQQANTPAGLSEAFADLRGREIDLGQVAVAGPRLHTGPAIDEQGLLHLSGFFSAGAEQVNFDLVFQMIEAHWRLFGIGVFPQEAAANGPKADVKVADAATATTLPDDATMVALIRGTVIALNQANLTGNYSVLRDISAPGFRAANDLTKLGAIFAELRARQIDLAPVAVIEPRLFRPPAIDRQGYLRLTGFFPSWPEQVNFDLAFKFGDGQWRLFGIGLNTSREVPAAASAPPDGEARVTVAREATGDGGPAAAAPDGPMPPAPRLRP